MRTLNFLAFLLSVSVLLFFVGGSATALTLQHPEITSPDQLSSGLQIDRTPSADDPDLITVRITLPLIAGKPYENRIHARGHLTLTRGQDHGVMAEIPLALTEKKGIVTGTFRLVRSRFEGATLHLSTYLVEADGMQTIGGGEIFQITLAGFLPDPG